MLAGWDVLSLSGKCCQVKLNLEPPGPWLCTGESSIYAARRNTYYARELIYIVTHA